ncbi:MAG: GNAT family N-acetyltransferase [Streptosporangiaceae bacterium]
MSEVVIRQARDVDLAAISDLRRESTREQFGILGDPEFEERFAAWFARESPRRITWVAEADGRLVGLMSLAIFERMPRPGRAPGRWGYLGNAFVLAAYRNQGVGGRMLRAILEYASENALARLVLSPSARSVPFYRRAGFRAAEELLVWTP